MDGIWLVGPILYHLQMEGQDKKKWKFVWCASFQVYFGMLDALLASEELPEEYRDRCQVKNSQSFFIFKFFGNPIKLLLLAEY